MEKESSVKKSVIVGFIVLGILIGIFISEIALRLLNKYPWQEGYIYNDELGWVPKYNFLPQISHNAIRIVFLGDSFTQPPEGYVKVFQEYIKNVCSNVQVINLGVAGYGTAQEYLMWQKYGKSYRPHLVILAMFIWNDIADNLNDIFYDSKLNINRPYYKVVQDTLKYERINYSHIQHFLTKNFAIARLIEHIYYRIPIFARHTRLYTDINHWRDFYTVEDNLRNKEGWKLTEALILKLFYEVEKAGAEFLLVGFDNSFTVEWSFYNELTKRYGKKFTELDIDKPMRHLDNFAKRHNLHYLNLTKIFRSYKKRHPNETLYLHGLSGHFSKIGIRIAGKAVFDKVIALGLLPCN